LIVRGSLTGKADMSVYMPYNDESTLLKAR